MTPGLPPDSNGELKAGQIVGERYRIETRLGTGGMGAVYRATHVHMRKPIALKVLHHHMTRFPEAVARFEREAVAAARIQHPNVASAIDFGRLDEDTYYLALEYVEGRTLREVLRAEGGSLPVTRALRIAQQLAEAVAAAHEHDIVHRDLKPENVMLLRDGAEEDALKLLDLGLAQVTFDDDADGEDPTRLTKVGAIFGTPTYMSPEQAAANAVGPSSDLYSLGVLLYEMLSGKPPFAAEAVVVLLSMHINERPPPLPRHVSPRLCRLVFRLLEKQPQNRPASARGVAEEIRILRSGLGSRTLGGAAHLWHLTSSRVVAAWHHACTRGQHAVQLALTYLDGQLSRALVRAERAVPALAALRRPVTWARYNATLGTLLLTGLVGIVIAATSIWFLLRDDGVAAADLTTPTPETEVIIVDEKAPQRGSSLSGAQLDQLNDIEALPVFKRTVEDWLTMGQLHASGGDWSKSTFAYRNAIQLDRKQARNPILIGAIRTAAEQRSSYQAAIGVATNLLGEPGMDLLFDLWVSTREDRRKRLISEFVESRLEILRLKNASDALQVRLELEFAAPSDCDALEKLVSRALRFADQRSMEGLQALRKQPMCDTASERCAACAGGDDDLQAAIAEARSHRAPAFSDGRYQPAP